MIARLVDAGRVAWDTPVRDRLPGFMLKEPYVSEHVTIGDLYAHRSGLPDHAGDKLEELDFPREAILDSLEMLPLGPFRASFAYTNYGMTAAALAAVGPDSDWASVSEDLIYRPLGMARTSSRFADFQTRDNRAVGHVEENGIYVIGPERDFEGEQHWSTGYDTDPQTPSGGVSSSVNDIASWVLFVLGSGRLPDGTTVSPQAWFPMISPQTTIQQATAADARSSYYGYGFFLNHAPGGEAILSHGGAFSWGASTYFSIIPQADVGIVVLTNAWPQGVVEAIALQFNDIVLHGEPKADWWTVYSAAIADVFRPHGHLAGREPPADRRPARPLETYTGAYSGDYLGKASVSAEGGGLVLRLGFGEGRAYPLTHWDADTFVFRPVNDAAPPGSISSASFVNDELILEHFNADGQGRLRRIDDSGQEVSPIQ